MTSGNCRDSGRLRSCALPRRCRLERLLWPRVLHLRRHHCHRHHHRALRRKVLPQEQSREIVVKETVATRARQCQFNTNDELMINSRYFNFFIIYMLLDQNMLDIVCLFIFGRN